MLSHDRYRWAFIPEASDDSGLEVRRQGTHQREFKPYVVRLAKLLRKKAKVRHFYPALFFSESLVLQVTVRLIVYFNGEWKGVYPAWEIPAGIISGQHQTKT